MNLVIPTEIRDLLHLGQAPGFELLCWDDELLLETQLVYGHSPWVGLPRRRMPFPEMSLSRCVITTAENNY